MCQQLGRVRLATVVDHVIPHRMAEAERSGDPIRKATAWRLFWDAKNWQSLCVEHHSSDKQRAEKSGRVAGTDLDGVPLDPGHHWRR